VSAVPPKVCPECREEFVATALRCADCDVDLVVEAPASAGPDRSGGLPEAQELAPLLRGGPWELEQIAHALAADGVASRIDPFPPEGGKELALYVRPEALAEAQHALEAYRAESLPDAPEAGGLGEDLHHCPACGADLPEDAGECPDCGLPFAEGPG